MKTSCFLFLMLLFTLSLHGQQKSITGLVTDATDGAALPGVSVTVKGTNAGGTTDVEGKYALQVPPEADTLVFSFLGYRTVEVAIAGRAEIRVSLNPEAEALSDVVVVGYGTQRKVNLTGSVESVKGAELATQPVMQTSQALMGKMPGVTALQNSSQPGNDAAQIRIRGIGTLSNSDPLVLIDGVPGNMNGVDPRDIEDISVLKDAAAASIYGSRAANGVILITTKRGTAGKLRVNYNGYTGWQNPTNQPEFLGGYEYMTLYNLARENLGQSPTFSQEYIDGWEQGHLTDPDQYPNTDWVNEVFTENGFQQHHSITLSGGGDMARVMGSLSYMDQNGNIPNYGYKRYNARVNTDLIVSGKVNFNFDINLRRSVRKQPHGGLEAVTRQAYRIPPIYASVFSNGTWGPGWNGGNPVARVHEGGIDEDQYNYVRAVVRANYKPIPGMQFSLMYSPQYDETFGNNFTRQYEYYHYGDAAPTLAPTRNELVQNNQRDLTHTLNATASYERQAGEHFLKGLVGYELNTFRRDWMDASRDNFPLQDYPQLGAGSQNNMQNDGSASEWGLQSFFARVNYDYKGKYLLEANIRRDGSSRFSEGNKYGTFPAFSAGWRVSEEPFFTGVGFIGDLKLRASWGRLGNQNIGTYPFASVIALGQDFLFGNEPASGAAQTDMANREISWETTETTNFGIDLGLLRNRLFLAAEYYIRNTSDILLEIPVPMTIGLAYPYQNAGKVRNKGWDLSLSWNDRTGDFDYGISFNISDVHNEVTDLYGTGPYIDGSRITAEGYPIQALFGYESAGLFQTQEEVDNAPLQFGALAPGDIRYADQNGDNVINADDRVVLGDPFPRYTFGMNLTANFKGFDFSMLLQGIGKRDAYLQGDAVWAFFNAGKIQQWHQDYWTPDNPDASYPRLVATTSHNNYNTTDFWIWSASYLRMRNLTLGYSFPRPVTNRLSMERLRLYVSGQNLFTIHNMPEGWDPEIPTGTSGAIYPITAVFTLGVDITF